MSAKYSNGFEIDVSKNFVYRNSKIAGIVKNEDISPPRIIPGSDLKKDFLMNAYRGIRGMNKTASVL